MLRSLIWTSHLLCLTSAQNVREEWLLPQVITPVKPVHEHPNISTVNRRLGFVTLHVPQGYYPDAFFLFIHIPKAGGTTFNVRSCPVIISDCGASCGCGNCGLPFFNSGSDYPVLHTLMQSQCPLFSYEINYAGFKYAFSHPVPKQGRPIYMLTILRNPVRVLLFISYVLQFLIFGRSTTTSDLKLGITCLILMRSTAVGTDRH